MYFFVDADLGDQIYCWVSPDHPSKIPEILVHRGDGQVQTFQATVVRPDLVPTLHSTGLCGFVLTEENVPGLSTDKDLAIVHKDDGMLVYRRPQQGYLGGRKLFRLETQLVWHGALNAMLEPRFQLPYSRLELLGEDTLRWIPQIPYSDSIYATGRIRFKPLEGYLRDNGFILATLLRDPWDELAEQLLLLRTVSRRPELASRFHFSPGHRSLLDKMVAAPWTNTAELESLFASLDQREATALSNPASNLFGAGQNPVRSAGELLANALTTLSDFHAVGLRSDLSGFVETLAAVLEVDTLDDVQQPEHETVREVATVLSGMAPAKKLIKLDLELYARVEEAYHAGSLEHQ